MANPDRALLVELLNRLGSTDDAIVLAAARELHQKAAESGLSWDELLQPDQSDDVDESHESAEAAAPAPGSDETARLIDRLLRKGVSDTLRDDLTEMKRQLAEGELAQEDRRYVNALAKRLGV